MTDELIGMWDIKSTRKYPADAKLCDYIVVTEFDIDSGSTVRHQYPENIVGVSEDWLAENMLPEGVHNRIEDSTYMILNRDKPRLDEEWLLNSSLTTEDSGSHETNFGNRTSEVFRYGLNLVHTKHDVTVRRGAVVKAMAVFSSYSFVDSLREPLQIALEKYFKCPERKVLEDLYNSLNGCDLSSVPHPSVLEKSLMQWGRAANPYGACSLPHLPSSWSHRLHVPRLACLTSSDGADSAPEKFFISIPLYRDLDRFGDVNICTLVRTFGDATMRIYSAILSRQRVIFVGYNHAARDVCCMVLSAAAAVSPLPNVLRRTYPYANLTDLSFLETVGFIAGVTNPMFLERDQWWDLACVMDLNGSGAVYSPDEKRRADEHSKGGSLASAPSSSSSRGGHILGSNILANVGGRLLPFENPEITQQHVQDSADSRFVTGVLSVITTKAFKSALKEEEWVARRFFDYSSHVIDIAKDPHLFFTSGIRVNNNKLNDFDTSSDRVKRSTPEGMTARTAALRSCPEFLLIPSSPWVWANLHVSVSAEKPSESITDDADTGELQGDHILPSLHVAAPIPFDADYYSLLRAQLRSMLHSAHSLRTETPTLFADLHRVLVSESSTQAMLSLLPLSLGGLDTIGMGLLHPNPSVRLHAVGIIKKVKQFPSTRGTVDTMNGLLLFAFERQVKLCDSGEIDRLIAAYDRRLALALPEEKSTVKLFSSAVVSSPSPRLFGTSKPRVGPLPSSIATSPTSSCPDSVLSPVPPSQSGTGLDDLPTSFLSFASAASGLLTGMLSTEESSPESENVTTRRGFNKSHEEEQENDRASIELIHY